MIRSEVHKVPESSTNKRVLSHPTNCFFNFLECWISSNLISWNFMYHIYFFIRVRMHSFISILSEWLHDLFSTPQRFWGLVTNRVCSFLRSTYGGTELFKVDIILSHPDDARADLLCLEMIFVVGPELNDGKCWYYIQMLLCPSFQKYFLQNGRDQSWTPIRGDHFWQSCPCHHPGPRPQAIGGAIGLKHCVAGPVLRGGALQIGDDVENLNVGMFERAPTIYVYIYILYLYYIYMLIHKSGFSILFWGGIISYVLERNDLLIQPTFSLKEAPIFWDLAVGVPRLPSLRLDFVLVTPVL